MIPDTPTASSRPRLSELWGGVKAELPIVLGGIPFGMIYGVLALAAGLTPAQAQAMSLIVFAGSAQFIGAQMMGTGAVLPVLWLTTLVVNLRHALYSTALGSDLRHLPRRWRWLLAYLLTDEAYAMTAVHYANRQIPLTYKHWFFLGAGFIMWAEWQISTAVGIFLGAEVPASWSLDFTLALTFIGIVIPGLKERPSAAAALSAGIVAVLAYSLPYKLGLMAAALTGIVVGVVLERRDPKGLASSNSSHEAQNP
ncbi:MAG: AzlC family ABC transporter permease [Chloroflexi bacterium]|nr:AzlC family ABC transporter permease [Chloroflexota bacterium]MBP7590147.1 AzlC family ABC transporter permease [Chloroflexota bacterium]